MGSAWNSSGTWEEKDTLPWCKAWLEEHLLEVPARDFGTGVVKVVGVAKVSGDASVGVIRGRTRHIFDLEVEVKWEARLGGDETKYKGKLSLSEVTHDLGNDDADPVPAKLSFTDEKKAGASGAANIKKHCLGSRGAVDPNKLGETLADDLVAALKAKFLPAFAAL